MLASQSHASSVFTTIYFTGKGRFMLSGGKRRTWRCMLAIKQIRKFNHHCDYQDSKINYLKRCLENRTNIAINLYDELPYGYKTNKKRKRTAVDQVG